MILLLATTLAWASDVYEVCVMENQIWSEEWQGWKTDLVTTFYTFEKIQFIVHKNMFEVNRKKHKIESHEIIEGLPCFREHENSFVCLDEPNSQLLWEFNYRSGKVTRDVMKICLKNGE
jgi:hypothetical protein